MGVSARRSQENDRLPAQPFRVLVLLAERAGELVPRKFSAICGAIAITSEWIAGLISA